MHVYLQMLIVGKIQGVGKMQFSDHFLSGKVGSKVRRKNITMYIAQNLLVFLGWQVIKDTTALLLQDNK